jgi:hypothetical protein
MSRYTAKRENGIEIAYGHDHATGFFFQIFDDSSEDGLVLDECSMFTKMSNAKMIGLMKEHNLPEDHIAHVVMDLPF